MVWGAIGGALISGYMANQSAKKLANAQSAAAASQMMPYTDAQPYTKALYSRGQDALNNSLAKGVYQGPTYASLNPYQIAGTDLLNRTGVAAGADSAGFMDAGRGFASNYGNLYNQASQDMLGNAIDYASQNTDPLLRAAMRTDYRNLMENQLPSTGLAASASGNTNSSRRGVREAVLERGYLDRQADTAADIQNQLIGRSLNAQQNQFNNQMEANRNLANTYNTGFSNAQSAANYMNNAGGMLRQDQQAQMDDAKARYEAERDFELQQLINYNAGILGRTPTSVGSISPVTANPMMAGLSGAMMGFGLGNKIQNYFSSNDQNTEPNMNNSLPYTDSYGYGVG